jgi:hypothetical protein
VDLATGVFEPRVFCPGFLRGLAFHNGHAIVGLSLPRDGSFSGLELDNELKRRDTDPGAAFKSSISPRATSSSGSS